jgi:hypothetical protein
LNVSKTKTHVKIDKKYCRSGHLQGAEVEMALSDTGRLLRSGKLPLSSTTEWHFSLNFHCKGIESRVALVSQVKWQASPPSRHFSLNFHRKGIESKGGADVAGRMAGEPTFPAF